MTGSTRHRLAFVVLAVVLIAGVAAGLLTWRSAIAAIEPPPHGSFDDQRVREGARLAAIGNCQGCHTTLEGAPFAGGVPLPTPFGTIYGSNITPDPDTGIGRWTVAAFARALREGVGRGGEHLYPAFPYDHFTRLTDDDVGSLYAYFMTREPVHSVPPANRLAFPLQFRPLLAGWKLLFFRAGNPTDAAAAANTDRGAYLIDALGHCSACHSPRNRLGAERRGPPDAWSGGDAEDWYAPSLDARSPSPVPWTADTLEQYLRTGIAPEHAISAGPMQSVTHELAWAAPADVRAIAERVATMMGAPSPTKQAIARASRERAAAGPLATAPMSAPAPASSGSDASVSRDQAMLASGRAVYAGACAGCHDAGRGLSSNSALPLPLAVAVHDPDPRSLIRIVRFGIVPSDGEARRFMPAFEGALDDAQLTALLAFLRASAAAAPPWPELAKEVGDSRGESQASFRTTPGR